MHWWCCCTWVCASSTDCTHWLGEVGTSGNLVDVQCSSRHHLCLSCPSQRGAKPDGPTLIAFENYIENYEGKLYWRNLSGNYAAGSISIGIENHCKAQHFRVISSKLHILQIRGLPITVDCFQEDSWLKNQEQITMCHECHQRLWRKITPESGQKLRSRNTFTMVIRSEYWVF